MFNGEVSLLTLQEVPLQKTAHPSHSPMPQNSHLVKTALLGTTVSQKMSLQEIPSLAIMRAHQGIIVHLELDWTGNLVPLEPSVTEHTLAW